MWLPIAALAIAINPGTVQAQGFKDQGREDPWNPFHIQELPTEVRASVKAMCGGTSSALHYFATYSPDGQVIHLHFEKFRCDGQPLFCNASGCLHQDYVRVGRSYRLGRSFRGPDND
ncbi:hypothetical protein [Rhodoplanes sp. Z2-YC6860]|uniref:hypothetical protein n=1 Tax=Rhodoplanes sp. Z2-YC6860 TaxID=674703 RepID=UPI00078C037E|nr:hypothetical protein [Rhodoplanes sp. Z2-YC6860]AMN44790.1 hypothetical protein RHPLAN_63840 [Rhodoplanes sp. Z2-YC6860]